MPPHTPNSQWHINAEADDVSLADAVNEFLDILTALQKDGEVTLNQKDSHTVSPNKAVYKLVRYETHPRGDLGLKLEIKWFLDNPSVSSATTPLTVTKKVD